MDKKNYSVVKSYGLIAFLNIIAKYLDSSLATCISYFVELFYSIPFKYIKGQNFS